MIYKYFSIIIKEKCVYIWLEYNIETPLINYCIQKDEGFS